MKFFQDPAGSIWRLNSDGDLELVSPADSEKRPAGYVVGSHSITFDSLYASLIPGRIEFRAFEPVHPGTLVRILRDCPETPGSLAPLRAGEVRYTYGVVGSCLDIGSGLLRLIDRGTVWEVDRRKVLDRDGDLWEERSPDCWFPIRASSTGGPGPRSRVLLEDDFGPLTDVA